MHELLLHITSASGEQLKQLAEIPPTAVLIEYREKSPHNIKIKANSSEELFLTVHLLGESGYKCKDFFYYKIEN